MSIQEKYLIDDEVFGQIFSDIRKSILNEYIKLENNDENSALDKLNYLSETHFLHLIEKIYDKSRITGQNIAKNRGDTYSTDHIIAFLNKTDIPCLSSNWSLQDNESTYRRFRTSCPNTICSRRCTYWREAVKGLIAGLGENTKFARHRSIGHGDKICVDLIYDGEKSDLKFGPVTDEIEKVADQVREKFADSYVKLILEGFSEGILYYRLTDFDLKLDSLRQNFARDILIETFGQKLPNVALIEFNEFMNSIT